MAAQHRFNQETPTLPVEGELDIINAKSSFLFPSPPLKRIEGQREEGVRKKLLEPL